MINARISFDRVLCPIALSPESDDALRYGIAIAQAYSAQLLVCHSAEPDGSSAAVRERTRKLLENSVRKRVHLPPLAALNWKALVLEGDPATAITREAAQRRVDLIVMRSRRRPHAAALLGSIAESVCRTAPCPVLVTHPNEQTWVGVSTNEISLERVLVAYDYSGDSELALSYGLSLAQEFQAELHLLHVLPPSAKPEAPELALLPVGKGSTFDKAAARLHSAVPSEAYVWCNVKQAVLEGHVYREVLSYAEDQNVDVICMGASGTGFGMHALFGSNADRVLRQAPCPVLIARPLRPAARAARESA